jgi:hypothetical protein
LEVSARIRLFGESKISVHDVKYDLPAPEQPKPAIVKKPSSKATHISPRHVVRKRRTAK